MENSSSLSPIDHHNVDNLPDLVYYYILKNLNLDDLWSLRLVSKRLYAIVKSFNIYELSFDEFRIFHNGIWFSTILSIKPGNQLDFSKLSSVIRSPSNNLLNLKHLKIWSDFKPLLIRLDDLNKFSRLRILEIGCLIPKSNDLLQLPELKALNIVFNISSLEDDASLVMIDTPQLHSLSIRNSSNLDLIDDKVKFNYPLSVKHLQLNYYDNNAPIFSNLESLEFNSFGANDLEANYLLKFNNLKKLKLRDTYLKIDKLKDLFKSKKRDLQMILEGVKLKEISKIDECVKKESLLEFQLNNYGELEDNLHFIVCFQYATLINLLPNQPSDLFSKYTNIQAILINLKIEDENRLISFVERCQNLKSLSIRESSLSQHFYDQLPAFNKLISLVILKDSKLNFQFIMKQLYLEEFITDQDVLISKQLNLNDFKHLGYFESRINNQKLLISKESKDRYLIDDYFRLGLPNHKYVNYNKVLKWSNWLRNKREPSSRKRKLDC